MIPWEKLALSAIVGYVGLSLLKPHLQANQGFFGFSGPNVQTSADIPTPNCSPAGYGSPCGSLAQYCNPPGVDCACGVDCADARAQYCRRYGVGGVCHDYGYGAVEGNQGLPGQGPVVGGGALDLVNSYGWGALGGGFGYPQTGYGYGQYPYGYGYPQYGYGYNPYQYSYNPYAYRYPPQQQGFYAYGQQRYPYRSYAVTGYDKRSGHFLHG